MPSPFFYNRALLVISLNHSVGNKTSKNFRHPHFEVVTLEPFGKRRKEFIPRQRKEGRMATERAGVSESSFPFFSFSCKTQNNLKPFVLSIIV
jgi:hypothetical protein